MGVLIKKYYDTEEKMEDDLRRLASGNLNNSVNLLLANMDIVYRMVHVFSLVSDSYEEMIAVGSISLMNSIKSYGLITRDKPFEVYAETSVWHGLYNYISSNVVQANGTLSIDDFIVQLGGYGYPLRDIIMDYFGIGISKPLTKDEIELKYHDYIGNYDYMRIVDKNAELMRKFGSLSGDVKANPNTYPFSTQKRIKQKK